MSQLKPRSADLSTNISVARALTAATGLALFAVLLPIRWEWSVLMDDIHYLAWMPRITDLWGAFGDELRAYWNQGRFYPVKYLANLVKWRYLPLSPDLFHWVNTALLATALGAGGWAVAKSLRLDKRSARVWAVFALALGLLQRPLLDVIALNSLAEGWVVLFFGLGLLALERHALLYRLAFVLAALSKEPAAVVFLASGSVHAVGALREPSRRARRLKDLGLDLSLFAAFVTVALLAKSAGTYLESYSLLSVQALRSFVLGGIKIGVGLAPVALLIALNPKPARDALRAWNSANSIRLACAVFGAAYLVLVAGRNAAGYLLIPVAFALALTGASLTAELFSKARVSGTRAFALLFAACAAFSLYRFAAFADGINGSTAALRVLLMTSQPRTIIVNLDEAAAQGNELARQLRSRARVLALNGANPDERWPGELVLLELSNYYGSFGAQTLERFSRPLGGWKQVVDRGTYRIYYGTRETPR